MEDQSVLTTSLLENDPAGPNGKHAPRCTLASGGKKADKTQRKAVKKLMVVLAFSTTFMFIEFVGGIKAHSLAIMTDAVHLLSDVTSFAMAVMTSSVAQKSSKSAHSYGYLRAEVLGAFLSVLLIWLVTGVLVYEGVQRIRHPREVNGELMFFIALTGVAVNLMMSFILNYDNICSTSRKGQENGRLTDRDQAADKGHADNNHDHSNNGGQEGKGLHHDNINVRAAAIHVLGDLIQSIGVVIAGALIWWHKGNGKWNIADPICTFIFAGLVMMTSCPVFCSIVDIIMERVPREMDIEDIAEGIVQLDGVQALTDLHVWGLNPTTTLLTAHVNIRCNANSRDVLAKITEYCRSIGIDHSTVQVDCDAYQENV